MAFSFALTIGDGSNTSFPVVHALHTKDIGYEVHDIATGGFVAVDAAIDSIDQITIGPFITPPTTNQYRVFVWSIGGEVTLGSRLLRRLARLSRLLRQISIVYLFGQLVEK